MAVKTILITGASSGLGAEMALQYAGPEHRLCLCGRNEARLQSVVEQCRSKGAEILSQVIDICDKVAVEKWIASLPLPDLVIANAGISGGFGGQGVADLDSDVRIFETNLLGVLHTLHPVIPQMMARKSGQIVIVSSLAGIIPLSSAPAYSASKAAVRYYGEGLAVKLAPYGIKVTVICPGFIKSAMTANNDFPMPFLMETNGAVSLMRAAIASGRVRYDFPQRLALPLAGLSLLPHWLVRAIFAYLPEKKRLPKD